MIQLNNKHLIHTVLGHAYINYMFFFCVSIFVDHFSPLRFNSEAIFTVGVVCVFLGTALAYWAQHSSHSSMKARFEQTRTAESFKVGPYAFLRSPTKVALFIMICGLGFVLNSIWISIFAFIAYVINSLFFIKKEQQLLLERYGEAYKSYRSKVRL